MVRIRYPILTFVREISLKVKTGSFVIFKSYLKVFP